MNDELVQLAGRPAGRPCPGQCSSRGLALAGDGSSNNVLTVEAGTYLFTFWEPLNGAAAHYTIVTQ